MELSEANLAEIVEVFRKVKFARITFDVSPENDYLQYRIEENHRIYLYPDRIPQLRPRGEKYYK